VAINRKIRSWEDCLRILGCRVQVKLCGNTYLTGDGDLCKITYYDTVIVQYHKNGDCTVNSGGFLTRSVEDRINAYIPYGYVYQEHFRWYFTYDTLQGRVTVPFISIMILPKHKSEGI